MIGQATRSLECIYRIDKKIYLITIPKVEWSNTFFTKVYDLDHLYLISKNNYIIIIKDYGSPLSIQFGYRKQKINC